MNSKDQRTYAAFICLVDTKVDPLIQCGWVKKISQKGKLNVRFFAFTKTALFICKQGGIARTLRISSSHAWIDLVEIEMLSEKSFSFSFKDKTSKNPLDSKSEHKYIITRSFVHEDIQHFISPVLSTLISIFPMKQKIIFNFLAERSRFLHNNSNSNNNDTSSDESIHYFHNNSQKSSNNSSKRNSDRNFNHGFETIENFNDFDIKNNDFFIEFLPSKPSQFVYLFISSCHSLNLLIDKTLCKHFRKKIHKKKLISFISDDFDTNSNEKGLDSILLIQSAFCRALKYAQSIKTLKVGGTNFHQLFVNLSKVFEKNFLIENLIIKNFNNSRDSHNRMIDNTSQLAEFEQFCITLKNQNSSKLKRISFETGKLTNSMIECMCNHSKSKYSISFINCEFENNHYNSLFELVHHIRKLRICLDDHIVSNEIYPDLLKSVVSSKLKKLSLINMNIDIANVFEILNIAINQINCTNNNITNNISNELNLESNNENNHYTNKDQPVIEIFESYLEKLDLSGNYCSNLFTGNYSLPISLSNIKLKNVQWEGNTFIQFLSTQSFSTTMSLDLSQAKFNGSYDDLPCSPPSPMISKLKWNHNQITPSILSFIEQLSFLDDVSFNYCEILNTSENDDILKSFAHFLEKVHLTSFSIIETLKSFKTKSMFALRSSLILHPTLKKLNISKNSIGDEGLPILRDIILQSESLVHVSFDSSEIQQPSSMITFFNEILSTHHLLHLSKPRNDLSHLTSKSSKSVRRELKDSWMNVESKIQKNTENIENFVDMYSSSIINSLTTVDSFSMAENCPGSLFEADWNVEIDLGYDESVEIWDTMRDEFSIKALTGITMK
ncbi:hypothetical protein TRFO_02220 [Tritrichomonas foetus]|uniref:Leucine Rich Repeat family protein n=1 Tax=Tritrichomonas foetus TaxID=1144522 RepID=A0A1J4J7W8_9EUKA|nr:hypothetical protein TRFO_02220 [Tritrichomonas foetus]|eukprot:OHS95240.1 hypothetical protein TRFO_02220 [Tritrichomonas foetus]